jgi:CyaY protein
MRFTGVGREGLIKMDDSEFARISAQVLARIEATADAWLQDDVIDIDSHRTGGLLELSFPNGSKVVVNTQPPLHELWLAARSGGYHFRWVDGAWRDTRGGDEFFAALSRELSVQAGKALVLSAN